MRPGAESGTGALPEGALCPAAETLAGLGRAKRVDGDSRPPRASGRGRSRTWTGLGAEAGRRPSRQRKAGSVTCSASPGEAAGGGAVRIDFRTAREGRGLAGAGGRSCTSRCAGPRVTSGPGTGGMQPAQLRQGRPQGSARSARPPVWVVAPAWSPVFLILGLPAFVPTIPSFCEMLPFTSTWPNQFFIGRDPLHLLKILPRTYKARHLPCLKALSLCPS